VSPCVPFCSYHFVRVLLNLLKFVIDFYFFRRSDSSALRLERLFGSIVHTKRLEALLTCRRRSEGTAKGLFFRDVITHLYGPLDGFFSQALTAHCLCDNDFG